MDAFQYLSGYVGYRLSVSPHKDESNVRVDPSTIDHIEMLDLTDLNSAKNMDRCINPKDYYDV